jgi:hypothetical protein
MKIRMRSPKVGGSPPSRRLASAGAGALPAPTRNEMRISGVRSDRAIRTDVFFFEDCEAGADGGSRTRTGFPPQDFKSCVSTSSTTSADGCRARREASQARSVRTSDSGSGDAISSGLLLVGNDGGAIQRLEFRKIQQIGDHLEILGLRALLQLPEVRRNVLGCRSPVDGGGSTDDRLHPIGSVRFTPLVAICHMVSGSARIGTDPSPQ